MGCGMIWQTNGYWRLFLVAQCPRRSWTQRDSDVPVQWLACHGRNLREAAGRDGPLPDVIALVGLLFVLTQVSFGLAPEPNRDFVKSLFSICAGWEKGHFLEFPLIASIPPIQICKQVHY